MTTKKPVKSEPKHEAPTPPQRGKFLDDPLVKEAQDILKPMDGVCHACGNPRYEKLPCTVCGN